MWIDAGLAYLHFLAIFALVWFLAREWTLLKTGAASLDIKRLALADLCYGAAAGAVLVTGVLRATLGAKGWDFYAHNPMFHAKVGLFILVALISVAPTRIFRRWRQQAHEDAAWEIPDADWRQARRWVLIEMHGLAIIPLLAVIMSRGLAF